MTKRKGRRDFVKAGAAARIALAAPARGQAPLVLTPGSVKPVVVASANGNEHKNGGPRTAVEEAHRRITQGEDVLEALIAGVSGSKESHKRLAGRMGLVMRSPEKLAADLQDLEQAGVVQASMSYDLAEMGADYWQEFFERMRSSSVNIGIYNEFFQLPEPEFIRDFSRSAEVTHTCVAMSPLSGNERVRRLNGKHYSNQSAL